jgi:hypothetical protein
MGRITMHQGDITSDAEADAIVNAANSSLRISSRSLAASSNSRFAAASFILVSRSPM